MSVGRRERLLLASLFGAVVAAVLFAVAFGATVAAASRGVVVGDGLAGGCVVGMLASVVGSGFAYDRLGRLHEGRQ